MYSIIVPTDDPPLGIACNEQESYPPKVSIHVFVDLYSNPRPTDGQRHEYRSHISTFPQTQSRLIAPVVCWLTSNTTNRVDVMASNLRMEYIFINCHQLSRVPTIAGVGTIRRESTSEATVESRGVNARHVPQWRGESNLLCHPGSELRVTTETEQDAKGKNIEWY